MFSAKKLLKLAKEWQKLAAMRRKRIALIDRSHCSKTVKAEKGCFVMYSEDQKRFLLPLEYLNNEISRKLLDMAEEELGLHGNEPLTLPWEAEIIEYAISLIKHKVTRDVEQALLISIASSCYSSSFHLQHQAEIHRLPVCTF